MKIIVLLLCISATAFGSPPPGYTLVFQSQFNNPYFIPVANDFGNIVPYTGKSWQLEFYGHTPYSGDFGSAYFTAPHDSSGQPWPCSTGWGTFKITPYIDVNGHWRSAMLSTVDQDGTGFSQALGYWECSMTLPKGAGTWPAFWLLGMESIQRSGRTTNEAEIDIGEFYGNNQWADNQHVHVWTPPPDIQDKGNYSNIYQVPGVGWQGVTSGSFQSGSHVYGCLITTSTITFYVDGVLTWTTPTPVEATRPLYAMVDYALGGGYSDPTPPALPLWIQWIRCYAPPFQIQL